MLSNDEFNVNSRCARQDLRNGTRKIPIYIIVIAIIDATPVRTLFECTVAIQLDAR